MNVLELIMAKNVICGDLLHGIVFLIRLNLYHYICFPLVSSDIATAC